MKVDFIYSDDRGEHGDYTELNSSTNKSVEEQLKDLIEWYNSTETFRYGKSAVLRTFVRIVKITKEEK